MKTINEETKKPAISVVIPVYNAGKYLIPCIDSIIAQTFTNFELLLIDDGSTDNSGEICDNYSKKYNFIRVIHKSNEGINATRRRGVREARGEWITFCDDDDTMEPDALQSLYSAHEGTDIVIGFSIVPEPDDRLPKGASLEECRRAQISGRGITPNPWAKLYKRTLLSDDILDFPRDADGAEDLIMNLRLIFKTEVAPHILYKHIYNFRRNLRSASHTARPTLKGAESYYKIFDVSIPKTQRAKYLPQIIFLKINGLFSIAYRYPKTLVDKSHPFIQGIFQEIKQCNYHLSLKEKIVLCSTSEIVLKSIGFLELANRSLRYRLKLLKSNH